MWQRPGTVQEVPAAAVVDLVRALGRIPSSTALCLDFDGTLAPIVTDPAAAAPLPGTMDLLAVLADRLACVAVVSGRPLGFLDPLVPDAVAISALYGLEERRDGVATEHADAVAWRGVVAELVAAGLPDRLAGAAIEDKSLSVTVHIRRVPELAGELELWAAEVAARTGLVARAAKASVELHPPIEVDKGTAVRALVEGASVAAYVGDDIGDLPAFDALDALAAHGVEAHRVVVASAELPAALAARADLVLDDPAELREVLACLAG